MLGLGCGVVALGLLLFLLFPLLFVVVTVTVTVTAVLFSSPPPPSPPPPPSMLRVCIFVFVLTAVALSFVPVLCFGPSFFVTVLSTSSPLTATAVATTATATATATITTTATTTPPSMQQPFKTPFHFVLVRTSQTNSNALLQFLQGDFIVVLHIKTVKQRFTDHVHKVFSLVFQFLDLFEQMLLFALCQSFQRLPKPFLVQSCVVVPTTQDPSRLFFGGFQSVAVGFFQFFLLFRGQSRVGVDFAFVGLGRSVAHLS